MFAFLPDPRMEGTTTATRHSREPLHLQRTTTGRELLGDLLRALPARVKRRALVALVALVCVVLLVDNTVPYVTRAAQESRWPLQMTGSDGTAVRSVQYLLRARGYELAADGIFGSTTRQRVVDFQRARGLKVDGIVGPETWSALVVPMRRGLRGNSVSAIQGQLNARGIDTAVDGIFGPRTEASVQAFQRARDLEASGIVGPVTWNALIVPRSQWDGQPSGTPEANPGEPPATLPETR